MEWISCIKETLRYIEDNLENDIDIGAVSNYVHVSPFYLQRGFHSMSGYTIGEYIRNRRLYKAACDLVMSEDKVIDVALRYAYETPESFTKAFTRFHGSTPTAVRNDRRLIRRFLPLTINVEISGGDRMNYVVAPMWGFKVIGFERIFSAETSYEEIPKYWDEICEKYCTGIYAGKAPANACEKAIIDNCIGEYGVCIDDIGDNKFRYLVAGKYTGGEVPEGMTVYELPGGLWAKFKAVGPLPNSLQSLNTQIFREWLPGNTDYEMNGCCNVEWYCCDVDKDQPNYECGIWVPVNKK